ncbi:MAG: CBS domain-containing protein [Planctomycetota bacterium]
MKRRFWGDKGAPGPERDSGLVRIEDVMTSQVISVTRHQTVGHVRALIAEHGIHSVPVVDPDGSAAGILTTTDLVASVADETLVGNLMTCEVETITPYADPSLAARLMRKHGIHHLVVTHEHKVVGIVSSFDLLQLIEDRRFVAKNMPTPPRKSAWEKHQDPGAPRSVEPLP